MYGEGPRPLLTRFGEPERRRALVTRRARPWLDLVVVLGSLALPACGPDDPTGVGHRRPPDDGGVLGIEGAELDEDLMRLISVRGYTGRIEEELVARLGRPIDDRLAELGRLLFFDPVLSLTQDNSCAGCHGPNVAFNDSKSIAIGIHNNGVVGPGRAGPRNLRRAPTIINAAFYPKLMWDGRFESNSLDPFDNSAGFSFPEPEGSSLSHLEHLLAAQAFTPVVAREEMTGFDVEGDNDQIRAAIARRVHAIAEYREGLGAVFPAIASGDSVRYEHIAAAIAEFTFTLVRADAPFDRYARGDTSALSPDEKKGALLFMNIRSSCTECHITHSYANEMFSDFDSHVIAVPQIVPSDTNVEYNGPGADEDFGLERHTGDPRDRYEFRTTPLRNVVYQPSFMHNGAFLCLEDAIRHHTDVYASLDTYTTVRLDQDLRGRLGPERPMIDRLHPIAAEPRDLSDEEIRQITAFVGRGLADPDARPSALRSLIPATVPSGLPVHEFDFDLPPRDCF
jgi:cytochrome c peroxidase